MSRDGAINWPRTPGPAVSRAGDAWGCARAVACPSGRECAILWGMASGTIGHLLLRRRPNCRASPEDSDLMPLDRNYAVPALVGNPADFLMIAGLAGTAYELAAITNDGDNLFAL